MKRNSNKNKPVGVAVLLEAVLTTAQGRKADHETETKSNISRRYLADLQPTIFDGAIQCWSLDCSQDFFVIARALDLAHLELRSFLMAPKDWEPKWIRKSNKSNKTNRKKKIHQNDFFSDLDEQPQKDESDMSNRHSKTTVSKAKNSESTTRTSQVKAASDVDVNAVPNPDPDTGLSVVNTPSKPSDVRTGVLPVIPSRTGTLVASSPTSGFSSLPPFSPFPTATILSSATVITSSAISVSTAALESNERHAQTLAPRHLPTVVVALLAVGAAFLLAIAFVITRICNRPRRRTCPTPSLPILQDTFPHQSLSADEESLFGGKERASGRPGSNTLWTWTQYSQPSVGKPEATFCGNPMKTGDNNAQTNFELPRQVDEKSTLSYNGGGLVSSAGPAAQSLPHIQQTSSVLARAANRVSTMSMSIYPGSPQSTQGSQGIGIAVGGSSPLTADGMPVLQRGISKPITRRLSKSRRSVRHSVLDKGQLADNASHSHGDYSSDVYGGVASPMAPAPVLKKSNTIQGRARVKAPYAPGALLRASSTISAFGGSRSNPFEDTQYILPPLSPALKSDALRERDTKALTSALGLASPPPLSPQPTIYPDDSVTLAGDRRRTRPTSKVRPHSVALSPGMEASARLGNLMLAEFSSMASLPSTRTVVGVGESTGVAKTKSARKRADDKPPRVPSPPPIPSLAQMALAHTNPEEYADYRSPTYSIYGLYEADRKSRAPGEGGY
ncbi:hypothetical protein AcW1_005660 [Taiwanofungus camphoratus]|nr:hypothetical protein AcW2_004424 [Antrodia cinnamomea]KAI0957189.1 hypothetical protein AcW1_005660 [Antrodia cinnamomea]